MNVIKELYFKSEYALFNICEIDWWDVTVVIDEVSLEKRKYQIYLFTLEYSNYVYYNLYTNEKIYCFKDIYSEYFDHIKCVFMVVVYENVRVHVWRLSGGQIQNRQSHYSHWWTIKD